MGTRTKNQPSEVEARSRGATFLPGCTVTSQHRFPEISWEVYLIAAAAWNAEAASGDRGFLFHPPHMVAPDAPCKIGYSINPFSRLGQLQTGNSRPLMLVGVIMCSSPDMAYAVEQKALECFGKAGGSTEWLTVPPHIVWNEVFLGLAPEGALLLQPFADFSLNGLCLRPFPESPMEWSPRPEMQWYRDAKRSQQALIAATGRRETETRSGVSLLGREPVMSNSAPYPEDSLESEDEQYPSADAMEIR